MIVVDTNVLVQLYRRGEQSHAAARLLEEHPDWAAPVLWRSEFRNTMATQLRQGVISLDEALRVQTEAEDFMGSSEFDVDSHSVLRLSESSGCSAYDCEFVALAKSLGVKLMTMDEQILKAFPETACRLGEDVAS